MREKAQSVFLVPVACLCALEGWGRAGDNVQNASFPSASLEQLEGYTKVHLLHNLAIIVDDIGVS